MSFAKINISDNIVTKSFHYPSRYGQELLALRRLNRKKSPYFPNLLSWDDSTLSININFCGESVCLGNLPPNHNVQIEDICRHLDRCGIYHGEPYPENILVQDGILKLIDFEQSVCYEQSVRVGGKFTYLCDYIEQDSSEVIFMSEIDEPIIFAAEDVIIKRRAVYNINLAHLRASIERL